MLDGVGNQGEGADGYPTTTLSLESARDLVDNGIKVYFVGVGMSSGDQTTLQNQIDAMTPNVARPTLTPEALHADGSEDLSAVLTKVMTRVRDDQLNRTRTAFTTETLSDIHVLYQFNAGREVDDDNEINYKGILDETIWGCVNEDCKTSSEAEDVAVGAGVCDDDDNKTDLASLLNSQATRTVYTIFPAIDADPADTVPRAFNTTNIDAKHLDVPTSGSLLVQTSGGIPVECSVAASLDAGVPADRETFADNVVGLILGDTGTCREGAKLGAILHGNPIIQTNLDGVNLSDPSFAGYAAKTEVAERPTMLYTVTHDGQIHGFRVDRDSSVAVADINKELWSYIPHFALPRLGELMERFDYVLDGAPSLQEILLYRLSTELDEASLATLNDRWRSVLIVPGGDRTSGVVALDVTDPTDTSGPGVLWEISPDERCALEPFGGPSEEFTCHASGGGDEHDFSKLGFVRGPISTGLVLFVPDGETAVQERALAVIPGGLERQAESGSGKIVYVVDLATGEKIVEFPNAGGTNVEDDNYPADGGGSLDTDGLDAPMTSPPACYSTSAGTHMSRCIIGDALGQLWYLRFAGTDPDDWTLSFFHDAFGESIEGVGSALALDYGGGRRAIREKPALALTRGGMTFVAAYHTSDVDDVRYEPSTEARLISITETVTTTPSLSITAEVNWVKLFPDTIGDDPTTAHVITGRPVIYADSLLQTVYDKNASDICSAGDGELWIIDYDGNDPAVIDDVVIQRSLAGIGEGDSFIDLGQGIPNGVQIFQAPTCFGQKGVGASGSTSGRLTSSTTSEPQLLVQQARGSTSSDLTTKGGSSSKVTQTLHSLSSTESLADRFFIMSWGPLKD